MALPPLKDKPTKCGGARCRHGAFSLRLGLPPLCSTGPGTGGNQNWNGGWAGNSFPAPQYQGPGQVLRGEASEAVSPIGQAWGQGSQGGG